MRRLIRTPALRPRRGHRDFVSVCAWSPDGRRILSASWDDTLRIWDAETGQEIGPRLYHLDHPRGEPTWASIDPVHHKILGMGEDAWRSVGWIVPGDDGLPEWRPAETFA